MIKDRLSTIQFIFGDLFRVQLYLSNHFCNNFSVRRQFYQNLLKLSGAFKLAIVLLMYIICNNKYH